MNNNYFSIGKGHCLLCHRTHFGEHNCWSDTGSSLTPTPCNMLNVECYEWEKEHEITNIHKCDHNYCPNCGYKIN